MNNEQENLRDQFEKETSNKCWSEPYFEDVGFSDRYVKWLENKVLLHVEQHKQLGCEYCGAKDGKHGWTDVGEICPLDRIL